MTYELYNATTSEGSAAEVWIDTNARLCKKYYKTDSITISGNKSEHDIYKMYQFYQREVKWSTKLKSRWVPELLEHGNIEGGNGFYIIQEWVGHDLMVDYIRGDLHLKYPDIVDQTVEMFKFFQSHNVYKFNNSLSNMTGENGRIMAFDFKYSRERVPESRDAEINSIDQWISKIDPNIKERLLEYI